MQSFVIYQGNKNLGFAKFCQTVSRSFPLFSWILHENHPSLRLGNFYKKLIPEEKYPTLKNRVLVPTKKNLWSLTIKKSYWSLVALTHDGSHFCGQKSHGMFARVKKKNTHTIELFFSVNDTATSTSSFTPELTFFSLTTNPTLLHSMYIGYGWSMTREGKRRRIVPGLFCVCAFIDYNDALINRVRMFTSGP